MEFTGSGGILLLVVAVLWLGFMTPSGKNGMQERSANKAKAKQARRAPAVVVKTEEKVSVNTAWFQENKGVAEELVSEAPPAVEKVVINRLPDPLSARLGKIEDVKWADIHELENARKEKENISSENLDEIMRRRRSNG
jgi:hypothetical protein